MLGRESSASLDGTVLAAGSAMLSNTDPLIRLSKQGDAAALRSLLSAMHPNEVRAYVNTADHRGNTALFHAIASGSAASVHALLSFAANSNHPNGRHDTPLHSACDIGHIELILLLLAYEANPHLINMHGQRCYDMGSHSRAEKQKIESMIKSAWQDLRRDKELKAQHAHASTAVHTNTDTDIDTDTASTSGAGIRRTSVHSARDGSTAKTMSARVQGGSQSPNYYQSTDINRAQRQISSRDAPMLLSALRWTVSARVQERRKWREESEARETVKQVAQHSLFEQLSKQFDSASAIKNQNSQQRKTLMAGPSSDGWQQAYLERTRALTELAEKERVKTRKLMQMKRDRKVNSIFLQNRENQRRLDEIRAVMTEYANKTVRYGNDQRVLTRMFAHLCWAVNLQEAKQKQQEEKLSVASPADNDSGVFLTELIGQESEELPSYDNVAQPQPLSEEEQRRALFRRVSQRYQLVPVQPNTGAYLSVILTTLSKLLPPPHTIMPHTAQPADISYPADIPQRSPTYSHPQNERGSARECKESDSDSVWQVTTWNDLQSSSNQSAFRTLEISQSHNRYIRSQSQPVNLCSTRAKHRSHGEARHSQHNDTANLSAMVMHEINHQFRHRQMQKIAVDNATAQLEKRQQLIETLFPDLEPSNPLYQLLLHADVNDSSTSKSDDDLLQFIESGGFLPSERSLTSMMHTLDHIHGTMESSNGSSGTSSGSGYQNQLSPVTGRKPSQSQSVSVFLPPLTRPISNDSVALQSTLVSKPAPHYF